MWTVQIFFCGAVFAYITTRNTSLLYQVNLRECKGPNQLMHFGKREKNVHNQLICKDNLAKMFTTT